MIATIDNNPAGSFVPSSGSPRVYSYARFSTPEQAQGNSLQRQTEAALKWTERKNAERLRDGVPSLVLDDKLRLHDLGVSAYRGANVGEGSELGSFLFACRQGLVPEGSFLLVESLDRVSRMTPRRVQRLLDDIVEAGVTIATLSDGQEYDAQRLDSDPTALLIALMVSWRAHEESKVKGQRVAAAWAAKRTRIRSGADVKLTAKGPSWLAWNGDKWTERKPHADTVRRIFALTLAGVGENKIATMLNEERVPTMGRGVMWYRSTVSKVIRSRSAMGELVPGRMDFTGGKVVRRLEQPIPNAYPAVVSQEDWRTAQTLKDGKAPAVRGRGAVNPLTNLFAGLARCPECGATMTRVYKGAGIKGGKPKLICTRAKAGAVSHPYRSQNLDDLHGAFLRNWQALVADVPVSTSDGALDEERVGLLGAIDNVENDLGDLHDLYLRKPSAPTASRIKALEASLLSYRSDLAAVEQRAADADHGVTWARVALLADHMEELQRSDWPLLEVSRINAVLRTLFEGVVVDYRTGHLRFRWRHGGETRVLFAWVDHAPEQPETSE